MRARCREAGGQRRWRACRLRDGYQGLFPAVLEPERIVSWPLTQTDCRHGDKMATRRKKEPELPIKDEEDEHPIPLAWRPTLREVVRAFTKRSPVVRHLLEFAECGRRGR